MSENEKKLAITFAILGASIASLLAGVLLPHNLMTGMGLFGLISSATGLFLTIKEVSNGK